MAQRSIIVPSSVTAPRVGRTMRHPSHPFYLYQRPFEITPFLIAPVLPGETVNNVLLQSRSVSDPLNNPLSGWWLEYYLFYVKLRDLDDRDDFTNMHLEPSFDLSSHAQTVAADQWRYHSLGGQKWVTACLTRIVDTWFRDEGKVAADYVITATRPAAKINGNYWGDSLIPSSQIANAVNTGILSQADVDPVTGGAQPGVWASDVEKAMRTWQFLRENELIQMDYEDYLATFGIQTAAIEEHRPELIRYLRDWTYPTSTIDPLTGAPTSAVSWATTGRADKKRLIKEPGFIFGVSCARPKVFLRKQTGSLTGFMDNAFMWLPPVVAGDPKASMREFLTTTGVAPVINVSHVVDIRDLFMYGEQFINIDPTTAEMNGVDLPIAAATNGFYPSATDANSVFKVVAGGTEGVTKYRIRQDGVVRLSILGSQQDTSPRGGNIRL